ncbi:MAG: GPW/gp25 family protein [Lachnospiraceae bacterium]|nr:GPW/gp25 family protein [Lachnospiraceae bacterium]
MANELDFLGTGMKFPPEIDKATGRFATSSGAKSVKESVYLILMTQLTERITRPDFGTDIMGYTFMDTGSTILAMMRRDITESLMRQEPRISDVEINTDLSEKSGYVMIYIDYTLAGTNQRDNMVFPFYLNTDVPEEEEEEEFYEPEVIDVDMTEGTENT